MLSQLPPQKPGEGEGRRGKEKRAKCQLYFSRTGHLGSPLPALFFFSFDEINYEHCPGSFDSGDTCQDKIFQKHLYLIIEYGGSRLGATKGIIGNCKF